ncbi:MAG: RidA family protein [Phycisphaeraceae bacterium]|nr:RidA family protein [Phycisphaeraceae bacterium]
MPTKAEVSANLAELGLTLPEPPRPGGAYEAVRVVGHMAYVAIQFPVEGGRARWTGRLGREVTTEDGVLAARLCALNVLAQLDRAVGFERVAGIAHIQGMMQTVDGWGDWAKVLDGASKLMLHALGEGVGKHSRSLMGVERLPMDVPVALVATAGIA